MSEMKTKFKWKPSLRPCYNKKLCIFLWITATGFFLLMFNTIYNFHQPSLQFVTGLFGRINKCTENLVPPLTIDCNAGRLGNQMCSLAVLLGLAALNNRDVNIMPCNKKILDPYFEISIPEVKMDTFRRQDPYGIQVYLRPEDSNIPSDSNVITGYPHPCSYKFYNKIRAKIQQVFRFKEVFRTYAENTLIQLRGNMKEATFVGVHVRRMDYVLHQKNAWLRAYSGREVDIEYFQKATKYYRDKYPNVIFVLVSDDLAWCRANLKQFGMHIPERTLGPAYDLALLAHCNHTLMTYGTYGFWGGYLAGGEMVYFDKFLKPGTPFLKQYFQYDQMYLPEWIGIDTTKPGFWDNYTQPPILKP